MKLNLFSLVFVFWLVIWVTGVVITKGWGTFFAVITFGIYSLYVIIEKVVLAYFPFLL